MGRHVRVQTDHKALKFMSSCVQSSARIARWLAFLQEFDLEIEHIPGNTNEVADSLSRNAAEEYSQAGVNSDKYLAFIIKPQPGEETHAWAEIFREAQNRSQTLSKEMQREPHMYKRREGLVRKIDLEGNERIVIPKEVAREITNRVHEFLLHFDTDKIISFIRSFLLSRIWSG